MLLFAYYLLKVVICSGVLSAYYWIFLRNKIFHSYNRFYLLAVIVLSLMLPLVKINVWHKSSEQPTAVIRVLQAVNSSDEYMDEVVLYSKYNHISKEDILSLVYITICLTFLFILIKGLFRIRYLLKNSPSTLVENIFFIRTRARGTPFSFLKYIFWNDAIDIHTKSGQQIFKHEVAHIQEKHSYDKLFVNSVLVLFWSNPFFWIIRKELNMIHEFVADRKAIEDGDTADFAAMILQTTYPQQQFILANNFFYSPIKRRLKMLTKEQKTNVSYISRLLVLPLAVIVFAAFTLKAKTYTDLHSTKPFTIVIDAGHGGSDAGAMSADGTLEKDINLTLAKKIQELNAGSYIKVILTREADIYQTAQQKLAIAKKVNADLFISIHADNATGEEKNGMSVYIPKDDNQYSNLSKVLASSVINIFRDNYQLQVAPSPIQREQPIWILRENTFPAILIEAGYMSNKNDISYLKTNEAIESFARNILNAIKNFAAANHDSLGKIKSDAEFKVEADKISENGTTISADHGVMRFEDNDPDKNVLIILNDHKYPVASLRNKTINFTKATFYPANDTEVIKRYGPGATGGVMIFEKATIRNNDAGTKTLAPISKDGLKIIDKDLYVDVSRMEAKEKEYSNLQAVTNLNFDNRVNPPLAILNGIETRMEDLKAISLTSITYIRLLTPKTAMSTYGTDGKNGVLLVNTEKQVPLSTYNGVTKLETPENGGLRIGNISSVKPDAEEFKRQKSLVVPDGFHLVSATVYFSGKGFETVVVAELHSADLSPIRKYIDQCIPGSAVTFDNVRVQYKTGGDLFLTGKSFSLTGKNEETMNEPAIESISIQKNNILYIGAENVIELLLEKSGYHFKDITAVISNGTIYKDGARYKAKVLSVGPVEISFYVKGKLVYKNVFQAENLMADGDGRSYVPHHFIEIPSAETGRIFSKVEKEPGFPGGKTAWQEYLKKNLDAGMPVNEGWKPGTYRIVVQFIVDTEGNITDVKTNDFPSSKTAKQCVELIKNGPKWIPAYQNGKKVKAYKKQPITFVIAES